MNRIRSRGRSYEENMDPAYIRGLQAEYDRYFQPFHWERNLGPGARVLVVDTTNLDLASSQADRDWFVDQVRQAKREISVRSA
jgi:deoxyguanosine kinase